MKKKVYFIIRERKECGKSDNIFYWVKKDLFGCFRIEKNQTECNEIRFEREKK